MTFCDGMADGIREQDSLKCKISPLQFDHQERNEFLWLKSSCQSDTFVGQQKDGVIVVLRIKGNGFVSRFVLDPSLKCAFWDNEEIKSHCQNLFAQHENGEIVMYTVDVEGVTETLHIPRSKLTSLIDLSQHGLPNDVQFHLMGCDQGLVVLNVGGSYTACIHISLSEVLQLRSCIRLPLHQSSSANSSSPTSDSLSWHSVCHAVKGLLAILDSHANTISLHSTQSGNCVCQIDLQSFSSGHTWLEWRLSSDHSSLFFLDTQFCVIRLNLMEYANERQGNVKWIDSEENERAYRREHYKNRLCHFGDSAWRKEAVSYHATSTQLGKIKMNKKCIGFKAANVKKTPVKRNRVHTTKDVSVQSLKLDDIKDGGWAVVVMEASSTIVTCLVQREIQVKEKAVCFVNFSDSASYLHRLPEPSCISLSNTSSLHMVWTEKFLTYISPNSDLQKDDLISWMMTYSGPGAADALCQANQWTRTTIPLSALVSSLQQRQLETLTFYFKSKQGLFSNWKQSRQPVKLRNEITEMESVLQLVSKTVADGVADPQARIFARRLLSLTMDFMYSQLEDARDCLGTLTCENTDVLEAMKIEVHQSCTVILRHVSALRKNMHLLESRTSQTKGTLFSDEGRPPDEVDHGSDSALEQYAKENRLSKLQSLLQKDNGSLKSHQQVISRLFDIIKKYLKQKDISSCQQILNNLGCEIIDTLWRLSQFYTERDFQEFITGQLSSSASLTSQQQEVVAFMHRLYQAYPNGSFDKALKAKNEKDSCLWTDDHKRLKNVIASNNVFLPSQCGELSTGHSVHEKESESQSELYASIPLAWLKEWTDDMKRSVLTEAEFLTTDDIESMLKMDGQILWQFLASHNMLDALETVVTKSASQVSHQWPSDPVTCVQLGWSHLQKEILSLLLRLKKLDLSVCKSRDVDMQLLLRMVGGPLQQPHPLAYAGSSYLNQFHNLFIDYCVRCGLQLPLWMYCSIHGIDVREIKTDENPVWFCSFQLFFSIPRDPKDISSVLLASQMAAAELWSPSSPSNPMTLEAMLNEGQIMAAVATLSYMKQDDIALSPETIEKHLQQFPKLKSILLPETPNSSTKPPMTVYQLLLGSVSFNIRRLFGWHAHNSIAGEDSPRAMPQFSDSSMLGVVPTQRKLAFTYYLKQGRPMYAFLAFLVDELEKREESISEKRINQACGACLWVAVQNFAESRVTSACVVFVEMLGKDSGLVRTMIHAGRLLLSNKIKTINPHDSDDLRKEKTRAFANAIAQELQACIQSRRRFGSKLIMSLQVLIANEIKDENLKSTSFEASQKWTMVNMLCHLLRLPMSTVFLKACAEADNWFMFIWFAQLHQYPTPQLQGLLHSFKSIHFRDHLHYVLNNAESKLFSSTSLSSSVTSTVSSSGVSMEKRNASQRSSLHYKIGVKNDNTARSSSEEEEMVIETPPVLSSFSTRLRHSEFHESELPESMAPNDVFRMLFHSQAMPCQWRCLLAAAVSLSNPLFAELAACCGCPAVPSVCGWLLASLDSSVKQDFLNHHGQLVSKWSTDKLELLIDAAMDCQREDTLATVFFLMQNKSPLYPFFCFINECMERGHHAASKTYIDQFKDAMTTFENQVDPESPETSLNGELAIIGDRGWIEKVAYQAIVHVLKHTKYIYKICQFLKLLDKHNMSLVFRFDVLNFQHLHQVVKMFQQNEIPQINLVSLLTSGIKSPLFEAECEKAVDFLIKNGKFKEAMELARLTDINKEKVILEQLTEEKQRLIKCGLWTARFVRAQFWEKSCQMLKTANSSFSACEQFYQVQLEGTTFEYEKASLCHHWFSLLEDYDDPNVVDKRENIFRSMWKHRIAAKMSLEEQEALDHIFDNVKVEEKQRYLKSDLVLTEVKSLDVSDVQEDISAPELEVLDTLMGSYLERSQVNACARVAAVFGYYSQDLAIIQTCISLACGKNTIENIEPVMRRLVTKVTLKRRLSSMSKARSFSSCSLDSLNSVTGDDAIVSSKAQEMVKVMEKLCDHCKKGRQVCRRIITCFKIAEILQMSYQEIVQVQDFDTLHRLLVADHMDKFFLAREFLFTSGLLDEEVTQFLAGLILETLKSIVSRHVDTKVTTEKVLNSVKPLMISTDGMEVFSQFIKLSENASLLGDKILQEVASLAVEDNREMVPSVLTIQTEMIILAHDCYTNASNMEGISHVLRAARVCCQGLAQAGDFFLMIRLLTGVGRYSEMQFVFHLLQQHHQFELLLRKGMDRFTRISDQEDKLKVAILEYLKRYQPDDNEAYSMVALKFSMYRDIAGLLEKCGHRALRQMKLKTLENNKDTLESLRKCLQYFQEAAESYVKDMSVRKAQRCIKLARLLSLQQQLLSNGTCVINLSRDEVFTFVSNHTRFIESMVVSNAYELKVNWRDAIYNNVLVGGDTRYLQELKLHVQITSSLVEDVLHKCKSSNNKASVNVAGVRKLLSHCKDAQLQYKLASELGLADIVSTLLKGDSGNYLQDVTMM